jgi:hypothetical protein
VDDFQSWSLTTNTNENYKRRNYLFAIIEIASLYSLFLLRKRNLLYPARRRTDIIVPTFNSNPGNDTEIREGNGKEMGALNILFLGVIKILIPYAGFMSFPGET